MQEFLVADLNVKGELQLQEMYSYALLERISGASDLIARLSGALWRAPSMFETPITDAPEGVALRWAATADSAGIATIRHNGVLMSLSLLACGLDPDADDITLRAFQTHLLRELHDTGIEPAFSLFELASRPLLATINFQSPAQPAEQATVALADRCFAAAYFRYNRLA